MSVTTVGLDLAKSVFLVHGVDAAGRLVLKHRIRRQGLLAFFGALPACVVGMEACLGWLSGPHTGCPPPATRVGAACPKITRHPLRRG